MNKQMVIDAAPPVKTARFVPARVVDTRTQYMRDYDAGYALYQADKRLPHQASEAMRDGWTDALNAGADVYWRAMQRQASAVKCVNWNSGAEVW